MDKDKLLAVIIIALLIIGIGTLCIISATNTNTDENHKNFKTFYSETDPTAIPLNDIITGKINQKQEYTPIIQSKTCMPN